MNRRMRIVVGIAVAVAAAFIFTSRADKADTEGVSKGEGQSGAVSERWDVKKLHVDSEYLLDEIAQIVRAKFDAAAQALPEGAEPDDEMREKAVAAALNAVETEPKYAVLKEALDKRKGYFKSFDLKPAYLSHRAGVGPAPWMEKTLPNGVAIKIHPNTILHARYRTEGWMSEEDRLDIEERERKAAALKKRLKNASESESAALQEQLEQMQLTISLLKTASKGPSAFTPSFINGDPKDPDVGVVEIDFGLITPLEKEK